MSRQLKVLELPVGQFTSVLRGEKRIRNLPVDAEVVCIGQAKKMVGVCVHSASYPITPDGELLPVAPAVVQNGRCHE